MGWRRIDGGDVVETGYGIAPFEGALGRFGFMNGSDFQYDVGLSFAGEQRVYVDQVAGQLRSRGIRVFYDDYEKAKLWGKDLYVHLDDIYTRRCRYCLLFVSKSYADKVWPNHERASAQAQALKSKGEYILPVRFDDTAIPGLAQTVAYIDGTRVSSSELAGLVVEKLAEQPRTNYLPSVPDRLYERLGIENDDEAQHAAMAQARQFLEALIRMTSDERSTILNLMRFACAHRTPSNIHINVDLLHRCTGKSPEELERLLGQVRSLGFKCSMEEDEEATEEGALGQSQRFDLDWSSLTDYDERYSALVVACEMVDGAVEDRCERCGMECLERLDFSQLSSVTSTEELHEQEEEDEEEWQYRKRRR